LPNVLRIKRSTGSSAPSALANAELAYAEAAGAGSQGVLYIGVGTSGAGGSAGVIQAIGGAGAVPLLSGSGTQTISRNTTFSGEVTLGASAVATTPSSSDNSTAVATTAYVRAQNYLTANQSITLSGDASGSGTTSISVTIGSAAVTNAKLANMATSTIKGRATSGTGSPEDLTASQVKTILAIVPGDISGFDSQVRTSRLDQMAAPTASVSMNSQTITNLADPTNAQDAATKSYVDAARAGLDVKQSARAATTANITLSGTQTVDGVSLIAGDRVLVKDQSTGANNGIYVVAAGAWSRASDADSSSEVGPGLFCFVEEGTANSDSGWVCTNDGTVTLGTTALTFAQFSGAGQITAGAGLTKSGNTLDVGTASTARIVVNADSIDLATVGTAGTYRSVTTDAYGRVTAGTNPTTLAGYGISDAQPLDAELTALAGLTSAADVVPYFTGSGSATTASFTSFGRSIVAGASASSVRTTLALGTIATQDANNVNITGGAIDGITFDCGTF